MVIIRFVCHQGMFSSFFFTIGVLIVILYGRCKLYWQISLINHLDMGCSYLLAIHFHYIHFSKLNNCQVHHSAWNLTKHDRYLSINMNHLLSFAVLVLFLISIYSCLRCCTNPITQIPINCTDLLNKLINYLLT